MSSGLVVEVNDYHDLNNFAIILEAVIPRLILPFQSNGSGCEEQNEVVELFQ